MLLSYPHAFHSGRDGNEASPAIHPLRSENHYLVFVNVAGERNGEREREGDREGVGLLMV